MNQVIGIAICIAGLLAAAQSDDVDPVVKAKTQRTMRDSQDLPPIPRGLTQPPPLPPPELHTHDIRKQRRNGMVASKKSASVKKPAAKGKTGAAPKGGQKPGAAKPSVQTAKKPTTTKT